MGGRFGFGFGVSRTTNVMSTTHLSVKLHGGKPGKPKTCSMSYFPRIDDDSHIAHRFRGKRRCRKGTQCVEHTSIQFAVIDRNTAIGAQIPFSLERYIHEVDHAMDGSSFAEICSREAVQSIFATKNEFSNAYVQFFHAPSMIQQVHRAYGHEHNVPEPPMRLTRTADEIKNWLRGRIGMDLQTCDGANGETVHTVTDLTNIPSDEAGRHEDPPNYGGVLTSGDLFDSGAGALVRNCRLASRCELRLTAPAPATCNENTVFQIGNVQFHNMATICGVKDLDKFRDKRKGKAAFDKALEDLRQLPTYNEEKEKEFRRSYCTYECIDCRERQHRKQSCSHGMFMRRICSSVE